ncbi:MAG: hypothetical protein EZS28_026556 [Streblomastix strix]|uniref:Uncharacterized protein n=1 Tax=Streblomastix strix TaxID=222440 RepID=A0A5J4V580_9EUKA|nr:MAG: hypothetical protein EZS28_026556 [Streblomastix strix]
MEKDQINSDQHQTPKLKIQLNITKYQFQHILQNTSQFEEFLDPGLVPSFRAIFRSEFEFADWNRQNGYKLSPFKFKTAKKRSSDPIVIRTEELRPIAAELQGPLTLDLAIIYNVILMISTDTLKLFEGKDDVVVIEDFSGVEISDFLTYFHDLFLTDLGKQSLTKKLSQPVDNETDYGNRKLIQRNRELCTEIKKEEFLK